MQQSQWEVVILKPTSVFYSFLASQLPESLLPEVHLLQKDNTAYVISNFNDDESTLNELEKHYPYMFRHEIRRWLGLDAYNEIENSFLDFLCCFKFELHSQIVLMEPSIEQGRQLIRIKPRSVLLKWMKDTVDEGDEVVELIDKVNIQQVAENGTVVIKNFGSLKEIKPFLTQNYGPVFETEMSRMCDKASNWPRVNTFDEFRRYFSVEIHTQLIHLNGR
jgi:hypothetical protein